MERNSDQANACPSCGQPAVDGHACGQAQPSASPRSESLIGKLLGPNYRIIEPVGSGAMGHVYVVEHLALKKRFAAKLLTADLARHPEAVARFETEAYAASQLDHENIVSVIDFGKTDDGCVFIIMELLRGKTLQARMDQGQLSAEEIVEITIQVCRALGAAHAAGIVHRDMKPDNIFLTQRAGGRSKVKVLDFGIAKARESSLREGRITKQGQLLGSPEYMSPEASRGEEVDARADIYAVGVMLYELLCGEVPFRHENYLKVLQMHAAQPPRPPRELVPDLPEVLERLILRALEKDPRRRQASIQELERELIAALPELAQGAYMRIEVPPSDEQWLPGASEQMLYGTDGDLFSPDGSGRVTARRSIGSSVMPTMLTRPRSRRGLLVVLWTGALVVTTLAWILLLRLPSGTEHELRAAGEQATKVAEETAARPKVPLTDTRAPVDLVAPGVLLDRQARSGVVRLRVDSSPAGAVATLDGQRLGRTPIDTWVAASTETAQLELDLRGYRTASRPVRLDHNEEIHVSLQRDARRSISSSRRGAGSRGSGRGASSSEKSSEGGERSQPSAADLRIKEGR